MRRVRAGASSRSVRATGDRGARPCASRAVSRPTPVILSRSDALAASINVCGGICRACAPLSQSRRRPTRARPFSQRLLAVAARKAGASTEPEKAEARASFGSTRRKPCAIVVSLSPLTGRWRPSLRRRSQLTTKSDAPMQHKIYEIPEDWATQALVSAERYQRLYDFSYRDPEGFWSEQGRRISWIAPYTIIKNTRFDPHNVSIKWFEDGTTNIAMNCIDRHLRRTRRSGGDHLGGRRPAAVAAHDLSRAAPRGLPLRQCARSSA